MPVQHFNRKAKAQAISGFGKTEFAEAIRDGRFPAPDTYLGERSPAWLDSTLEQWQAAMLEAGGKTAAERAVATAKPTKARLARRAEKKAVAIPKQRGRPSKITTKTSAAQGRSATA